MDTLVVTIIGQDLFKMVADKFELAGFNQAKMALFTEGDWMRIVVINPLKI